MRLAEQMPLAVPQGVCPHAALANNRDIPLLNRRTTLAAGELRIGETLRRESRVTGILAALTAGWFDLANLHNPMRAALQCLEQEALLACRVGGQAP